MSIELDPERREVEALRDLGLQDNAATIEIGCGDGRLMDRLTRLTACVVGIDPSLEAIRTGRARSGRNASRRVVGDARALPFRTGTFDQAIFGWSL